MDKLRVALFCIFGTVMLIGLIAVIFVFMEHV
nr:MAG TPA: Protein of unknown function (DUF1072) [Caudoviricetes sp.]DAL05309.1 MAG TPA: Protein of unknown function (DUF1072) [Caudoviricetes sp.]